MMSMPEAAVREYPSRSRSRSTSRGASDSGSGYSSSASAASIDASIDDDYDVAPGRTLSSQARSNSPGGSLRGGDSKGRAPSGGRAALDHSSEPVGPRRRIYKQKPSFPAMDPLSSAGRGGISSGSGGGSSGVPVNITTGALHVQGEVGAIGGPVTISVTPPPSRLGDAPSHLYDPVSGPPAAAVDLPL